MGSDVSPGASSAPAPAAPAAPEPSAPALSASQAAARDGNMPQFREARRAERAGTPLPAPPPVPETPAAQAGPTPAASTDATAKPPASEPGAPTPAGHGGNAETRIQELVRKNKELEARLASAAAGTPAHPQTSPAAPSAAAPVDSAADPQPNPDDGTKYPQGPYDPKYIADLGAWGARQEHRRLQADTDARARESQATADARARFSAFSTRIEAAKTADPDFVKKLTPEVLSLKPLSSLTTAERGELALRGDIATLAAAAVMDEVVGSESGAALLLHFSTHPEEMARLTSLHPREMLREFLRLEARYATAAPAAGAAPPTVPTISQAPAPPAALTGKHTTPADPLTDALKRGDFAAYRAAKRARLAS